MTDDDMSPDVFDAASRYLLEGARQLEATAKGRLTPAQVARMFLRAGVHRLVPAIGPLATAVYLRSIASVLDGGDQTAN